MSEPSAQAEPFRIPADGRYDAVDGPESQRESRTGRELADGLRDWQRTAEGAGGVVIRGLVVRGLVDLSFERFASPVILVDCLFDEGLKAWGADLAGLELYEVRIPLLDLSHARIRGDLRLVDMSAPRRPEGGPVEATSVRSAGTVVVGRVDVTGSGAALTEVDEDHLLAAQRRGESEAVAAPSGTLNWDLLLHMVGLVTALTAWVAVIGGATLWAHLESINAPALPTLAAVGQGWMVTQGLQSLLVPLLLATVVSTLVYFSRWERRPSDGPNLATMTTAPARHGAGPTGVWRRLRPVRVLRRIPVTDRGWVLLLLVVVTALITAWLYVAEAAWEVLAATFLVIAPAMTRLGQIGTGRKWRALLVPLVTVLAVAWVFWSGDAPWEVSLISAVGAAGVSAALQAIFRRSAAESAWPGRVVMLVAVMGLLLSLLATVEVLWVVLTVLVTVLTIWVTLGALAGKPAWSAAVTIFVAIVVWSGAVQFARVIGDRTPDLPVAVAHLEGGGQVGGFLVGRTSDYVYLAQNSRREDEARDPRRHVVALPGDEVERVVFGESMVLPSDEEKARTESGGSWWDFLNRRDGDDLVVLGDSVAGCLEDDDACRDLSGTQGTSPTEQEDVRDPDDPAVGPGPQGHTPESPSAFQDQPARDSRDEVLLGAPTRLELIGLHRSERLVYLDVRVVNMGRTAATASDLLGLVGRRFNTPRLVDPVSGDVFEVTRTEWHCDCSGALDRTVLAPSEAVRLQAMFTAPRDLTRVDVTVPGFGVFRDLPVT